MLSIIIPVYKNAESIPDLLDVLGKLQHQIDMVLEVVFVIDGSPDNSYLLLKEHLPQVNFLSSILVLSRNFGSFAAIRTGLIEAKGQYLAVMAADLQEPPQIILDFLKELKNKDVDVVLGERKERHDPLLSKIFSGIFWFLYRKLVHPETPPGGVDIFACKSTFRDHLITLDESNSSLIGLLFWLGFRRSYVPYSRLARKYGKSGWSFRRKLRYLTNSLFSFTDLPIRLLTLLGGLGILTSFSFGLILFMMKLLGLVNIPGYTVIVLISLFSMALNMFSLGMIGSYVWRTFENTKKRPQAVVMLREAYNYDKQQTIFYSSACPV